MSRMLGFEHKLDDLDISLFEKIHSQTTDNDKRSLLAVQKAVRELVESYSYLEIGSYIGGSLQPHLLDERCSLIYSIDKRPVVAADERGVSQVYLQNTTEKMLENLRSVSGPAVSKVKTFDRDASEIDPLAFGERPQLCFIDGEHTDEATWNDYRFCRRVIAENGAIVFHDAMIIYNCLSEMIDSLKAEAVPFRAYNIPDVVFVLELGDFPLHRTAVIADLLANNHVGYLRSLKFTDQYRRFANRPIFRSLRSFKARITGTNVAK